MPKYQVFSDSGRYELRVMYDNLIGYFMNSNIKCINYKVENLVIYDNLGIGCVSSGDCLKNSKI